MTVPEFLENPNWWTVIIALPTAIFAFWQVYASRRISHENYALGAFQKFLELKIQYADAVIVKYTGDWTKKEQVQKSALFDILGTAGEALLEHFHGTLHYSDWRFAVHEHLKDFDDLIGHVDMERQLQSFGKHFRELVNDMRKRTPLQPSVGAT